MLLMPSMVMAEQGWPQDLPPKPKIALSAHDKGAALRIALGGIWKTYGETPGKTGIAPQFSWAGSRNLKSARVIFPKPSEIAVFGGTLIGYQGDLVLPIALAAIDNTQPIHLKLAFSYAICADLCVPLEERLTLTLAP